MPRRRSSSPKSIPSSPSSLTRSVRAYHSDSTSFRSCQIHDASSISFTELTDDLTAEASQRRTPASGLPGKLTISPVMPLLSNSVSARWKDCSVLDFGNNEQIALGDDSNGLERDRNCVGHLQCAPAACQNSPMNRNPTCKSPDSASNTADKSNIPRWASLFDKLPSVAGVYTPQQDFHTEVVNGRAMMPIEVQSAGKEYWSDYLVGFFLGVAPSYLVVREQCNKFWRLRGRLNVQYFGSMFYLKFSNPNDKLSVLERDPIIIAGQPFIITPWSVTVGRAREQVHSIPVWATFTNVPSVLQPLIGLDWLASLVGKLKCFDSNTVARKSLNYARALIEITPMQVLPTKLQVTLVEGFDVDVNVSYSWSPDICTKCHSFGHLSDACTTANVFTEKFPLSKPLLHWVPKPSIPLTIPALHVPSVDSNQNALHDVDTIEGETAAPVDTSHNKDNIVGEVANPVDALQNEDKLGGLQEDDELGGEIFTWNAKDGIMIHDNTQMKYNPKQQKYYLDVGGEGGTRRLFYQVDDVGLILVKDGEDGIHNVKLLNDNSWDRSMIYSVQSPHFVVGLAWHFDEAVKGFPPRDANGE